MKLEGKLCSRKHAAIGFDPHKEHVYLSDLSSAHGTYVDEKRLEPSEKKPLKLGQDIWFGNGDGGPRYTVHAVCSRKRVREFEHGSNTDTRPRNHAHPPASAPHSAAHARHVDEPPAAGGDGKTLEDQKRDGGDNKAKPSSSWTTLRPGDEKFGKVWDDPEHFSCQRPKGEREGGDKKRSINFDRRDDSESIDLYPTIQREKKDSTAEKQPVANEKAVGDGAPCGYLFL